MGKRTPKSPHTVSPLCTGCTNRTADMCENCLPKLTTENVALALASKARKMWRALFLTKPPGPVWSVRDRYQGSRYLSRRRWRMVEAIKLTKVVEILLGRVPPDVTEQREQTLAKEAERNIPPDACEASHKVAGRQKCGCPPGTCGMLCYNGRHVWSSGQCSTNMQCTCYCRENVRQGIM